MANMGSTDSANGQRKFDYTTDQSDLSILYTNTFEYTTDQSDLSILYTNTFEYTTDQSDLRFFIRYPHNEKEPSLVLCVLYLI